MTLARKISLCMQRMPPGAAVPADILEELWIGPQQIDGELNNQLSDLQTHRKAMPA
jgi:hypothetical protein